ncbi:MAG: hypothetical protein JWQ81_1656 [Amycolatopsis sp.]|jgi:hypothetical protein|uniref:DUF397 domain-containing protein n=1 Tax=Amycolatopsis sp. TaxID=37632 RepID=UPI0026044BC3|nr:DUF397 domain-containing protein [Amycolatopsis sp.]MCU1680917.1 hypothetical protein [Amycolatopsis sp.]
MTVPERAGPWKKSSYSGSTDNCVEVATGNVVGVRDTKNREGGKLTVSSSQWAAFTAAVKTQQ